MLCPMTGARQSKTLPGWKNLKEYHTVKSGPVTMLDYAEDRILFGSADGILSFYKLEFEKSNASRHVESYNMKHSDPILQATARTQNDMMKIWVLQTGRLSLICT